MEKFPVMSNYTGLVASLLGPSPWRPKILEGIAPKLRVDALGGWGFCSSLAPSDSGMAKQRHGGLQNVPQSSFN